MPLKSKGLFSLTQYLYNREALLEGVYNPSFLQYFNSFGREITCCLWFAHFQGAFREFCDQPGINIWMET